MYAIAGYNLALPHPKTSGCILWIVSQLTTKSTQNIYAIANYKLRYAAAAATPEHRWGRMRELWLSIFLCVSCTHSLSFSVRVGNDDSHNNSKSNMKNNLVILW